MEKEDLGLGLHGPTCVECPHASCRIARMRALLNGQEY